MATTSTPATQQEDVLTFAGLCNGILQKPCNAGPRGFDWQTVMGSNMDTQLDRLYWARDVAYPLETPVDALYYLANERGLERVTLVGTGGTLEDETLHRLRLQHAWTIWQISGSQQGHVEELSWTGLGVTKCYRRAEFSTPPPVGSVYVQDFAREVWSQFDILVREPMAVGPLIWGSFTWGQSYTWGTTMSLSDVRLLRRLIRDHKSAHDTCTYLYFDFASGAIFGTFVWGDGTRWGGVGDVVVLVCGEKQWETLGLL